ncbi:hypothetical protein T265_15088, partial [Opisthorchis viverrini]
MTSVFNTDASLPYNHDSFEIMKKGIKVGAPTPPDNYSGNLDRNWQLERYWHWLAATPCSVSNRAQWETLKTVSARQTIYTCLQAEVPVGEILSKALLGHNVHRVPTLYCFRYWAINLVT